MLIAYTKTTKATALDHLLASNVLARYLLFLTHDSITRAEFEHPFGLKRITAYSRLKGLEEMCVIQAVGYGKETVYVSGKK